MPPSQISAYASCYQVGVARVYLVDTLGNYRAPTRAELDAGLDVTRQVRGIDGWQVVADRIERRDYRKRFTATTPGRRYVDESSLTIYAARSGADARSIITNGYTGYVVFLDGGDTEGYTMDIYPVRCVARPRQRSDSDPFAILYQFAVTGPPAIDVTVPAWDDPYTWPELFSDYPLTRWAEGSNHGLWTVKLDGMGQIIPVDVPGVGRVLQLESSANPDPDIWGDTASSLVVSTATTGGDIQITARVRTIEQMRNEADPSRGAPNGWEAVWLGWNYTEPSTGTRRFYYVTLKPVGFELGKVDQSIALPGGQRFLWTDSDPFDFGTWYSVRIVQIGSNIKVWVDDVLRADFTDGVGSTGFPLWGATVGEVVMTGGGIVLYHEDARVQFDDIYVDAADGYSETYTGSY